MSKQTKGILIWGSFIIVIVSVIFFVASKQSSRPGPLDEFASCITGTGAQFYGAFWCPHCQDQKKIFGRSAKKLPYVECSTPDGKGQLPACKEKGIEGYPTWVFADGSRISSKLELTDLAEKTKCTLPASQ
jgi:thiol-disulfide isomerase/thioredoxin